MINSYRLIFKIFDFHNSKMSGGSFEMDDASLSDGGWISWFCSLEGHEFFAEIPEEYIRDAFNLYGLRRQVAHYSEALQMILSEETPDEEDLQNETFLEVY